MPLPDFLFINNKRNFRKSNEKKTCKLIDEIWPQEYKFKGIIEKTIELIKDILLEKKFWLI